MGYPPTQLIGLLDCNSFFASCEQLLRPDLKDKPVVVLSNNDGVVVARSAEAKKLGIPIGAESLWIIIPYASQSCHKQDRRHLFRRCSARPHRPRPTGGSFASQSLQR